MLLFVLWILIFEVHERLLDAKFRILHLMDSFCTDLSQPAFEWFGFL